MWTYSSRQSALNIKVITMIRVSFVLGIPYYLYRRSYYMTHQFISLSKKFDHPHRCRKILSQS